jgi:hypothetical protein
MVVIAMATVFDPVTLSQTTWKNNISDMILTFNTLKIRYVTKSLVNFGAINGHHNIFQRKNLQNAIIT